VKPYKAGNGENTVKVIEELKQMNPHQKMLLMWDGACYQRGQEMQQLLMRGDKTRVNHSHKGQ
jgi:hypothetical protein